MKTMGKKEIKKIIAVQLKTAEDDRKFQDSEKWQYWYNGYITALTALQNRIDNNCFVE